MKNIKIKIANRIHLFNLPEEIRDSLTETLTMPNPKWFENEKMGYWNGNTPRWLCFYTESKNRISVPVGILAGVIEHLSHNLYHDKYDVYDAAVNEPALFKSKIKLRPFQEGACGRILTYRYATLEAPTGSGKTVMGLYLVARRQQKTLIIVHTKELAYQWVDRINTFLEIKNKIGFIGDGKYSIGEQITVGMVQSIYKRIPELKKEFGHVICDEAHRCPSREMSEAIAGFHAKYKLGLTATAFRRDGLSKCIFWFLGPLIHKVDKEDLFEEGHILEPEYRMVGTDFEPEHDAVAEYSKMLSELTRDEKRNRLICSDVSKFVGSDKCCLIISDRKAHCYELMLILQMKDIRASVLTGETPKKERKEIVANIEPGKIQFVIATGQLIGEGFDCKNLDVLFMATPIRFNGRVLQYIGRIMRIREGKDKPIVYDYVDRKVGVLYNSAEGRKRVYGEENVIEI